MYPGMPYSPPTRLTEPIDAGATEIVVDDPTVFPEPPNYAVLGIDENGETIEYGGILGNKLINVKRGVQREGEAKAWPPGTVIACNIPELRFGKIERNIENMHEDVADINNRALKNTPIEPYSDLNDITDPGFYHATDEVAETLANSPIATAFVLQVIPAGDGGEVKQSLTALATSIEHIRWGGSSIENNLKVV